MPSLKRWRLVGIITLTVLGFVLHYLFSWTNESKLIGLFVPVNESVWEHLKLGYWSVVLFSIAEHLFVSRHVNNYYPAKTIGVLVLEMTIILLFYGYTFIAHKDIFLLDIFSYILAVILCQYVAYTIFRLHPFSILVNRISVAAFISIGVLLGVLTYYPPHFALFKDPHTGTYGIAKEK